MLKIINELLAECKAVPFTEAIAGGQFYRVMSQKFKLPNGTIITREFLDKKPAAAVVPITTDGKVVCVIQPASLTEEGSLIEIPAGYAENDEISASTAMRELVEEVSKDVIKKLMDANMILDGNTFIALSKSRFSGYI